MSYLKAHFEQLVLLSQTPDCNKLGVFLVVLLKGNSAVSSTFLETASVIDFFSSDRQLCAGHTSFFSSSACSFSAISSSYRSIDGTALMFRTYILRQ